MGRKIDYQKLLQYLEEKYGVSNTYYFGGVELHDFAYDYQRQDTVPVGALKEHLSEILNRKAKALSDSEIVEVGQHLQRARFYCKLAQFGYNLYLKPVKSYEQDGATRRKANCDVEMAFHLMKDIDRLDRAVILSGDGDFLPVLKHLRAQGKEVIVLSRGPRTAKEIRRFAGDDFRDFEYLRELLRVR